MDPKLIPCLLLFLGIAMTGCRTENIQDSHGQAVNLRGDHLSETIQIQSGGAGTFKNGVSYRSFLVEQTNWLTLFYTNQPDQVSQLETNSYLVHGWLAQNLSTESLIHLQDKIRPAKSPENFSFPASEPLYGKMETIRGGWRQKNRFHVRIDLTGSNGLALKAEFESYDRTKFDPNKIWQDPLMLFGITFGLAE